MGERGREEERESEGGEERKREGKLNIIRDEKATITNTFPCKINQIPYTCICIQHLQKYSVTVYHFQSYINENKTVSFPCLL